MTRREPAILLVVAIVLLALSRLGAAEPGTWIMEVAPILLIAPILVVTARRFPLTPLVYRLLFVHALILMVGGHYTYAKVPLGFWVQNALGLARNHYDRLGHLAQGFVPAMLAREVLLRRSPLVRGKWLAFLVVCVCLALSATYELIEWLAAVLGGSAADAFLGTQGDVWDTQWDMFMALVGAISALLLLSRVHDRQLARITAGYQTATTERGSGTAI
jgi:putative membrane protein